MLAEFLQDRLLELEQIKVANSSCCLHEKKYKDLLDTSIYQLKEKIKLFENIGPKYDIIFGFDNGMYGPYYAVIEKKQYWFGRRDYIFKQFWIKEFENDAREAFRAARTYLDNVIEVEKIMTT